MVTALAALSLLLVGGAVVAIWRRKSAMPKSFEDAVQNHVNEARQRLGEIRKWARTFRTQRKTQQVFLLANDLTVRIETLLQALEQNPEDRNRIGLHLSALVTIEDALRGLAESMSTLDDAGFQKELGETEQFLRQMQDSYSGARKDLALDDLIRMRGNRAAGKDLLGRGLSIPESPPDQRSDGQPPPEQRTLIQ